MDIDTLRIISTVLLFITFVGIFIWSWSSKRKRGFNEAANLPFNEPEHPAPLQQKANNNKGEA